LHALPNLSTNCPFANFIQIRNLLSRIDAISSLICNALLINIKYLDKMVGDLGAIYQLGLGKQPCN